MLKESPEWILYLECLSQCGPNGESNRLLGIMVWSRFEGAWLTYLVVGWSWAHRVSALGLLPMGFFCWLGQLYCCLYVGLVRQHGLLLLQWALVWMVWTTATWVVGA